MSGLAYLLLPMAPVGQLAIRPDTITAVYDKKMFVGGIPRMGAVVHCGDRQYEVLDMSAEDVLKRLDTLLTKARSRFGED